MIECFEALFGSIRNGETAHLHDLRKVGRGGRGLGGTLRRYSGGCRCTDARRALAKISAMALDLLPDNHPGVDPESVYLQITALREAEPAAV
jgi:hypothetical protein